MLWLSALKHSNEIPVAIENAVNVIIELRLELHKGIYIRILVTGVLDEFLAGFLVHSHNDLHYFVIRKSVIVDVVVYVVDVDEINLFHICSDYNTKIRVFTDTSWSVAQTGQPQLPPEVSQGGGVLVLV